MDESNFGKIFLEDATSLQEIVFNLPISDMQMLARQTIFKIGKILNRIKFVCNCKQKVSCTLLHEKYGNRLMALEVTEFECENSHLEDWLEVNKMMNSYYFTGHLAF